MKALKEQIHEKLDNLEEEDLEKLLSFVESLERQEKKNRARRSPGWSERDVLIGLFDGPSDLADQSEILLKQGLRERSGWTWKKDS